MIIPSKNLFLVTSAIQCTNSRFYSWNQRFGQTMSTLSSIREKAPDAIIVLSDASVEKLSQSQISELQSVGRCAFFDASQSETVSFYSRQGLQALAETCLLYETISILKQQNYLSDVKRIFKVSGRTLLTDGFNLSEYDNMFGKYVFKKRIPTWMNQQKHNATDLLITRMYSFCPSLVDNYMNVLFTLPPLLGDLDFEHAHFVNIMKQKEYLVEFDNIHCSGWLSGNGTIETY